MQQILKNYFQDIGSLIYKYIKYEFVEILHKISNKNLQQTLINYFESASDFVYNYIHTEYSYEIGKILWELDMNDRSFLVKKLIKLKIVPGVYSLIFNHGKSDDILLANGKILK